VPHLGFGRGFYLLDCSSGAILLMSVGSSSFAREPFTRFDTGHFAAETFGLDMDQSFARTSSYKYLFLKVNGY